MDDTQLILTALSQVPDLVEAARTYKDVNDKAINTISTAVKQQPKAIIPDSEMTRLKNNISQTPCALPETDEFTKALADQVYKIIAPVIRSEIKSAVGATDITIKHDHTHNHYSLAGFWKIVNDTAKKWIIGLAMSTLILVATLVIGLVHLTNSEMYLGMKYMEIYDSGLLTKSEKEKLLKETYMVSLYPKAYKGYPKAFKERLRKNNSILNDRELEKSFKGKISGKPKV
jgi:hypothetical protein